MPNNQYTYHEKELLLHYAMNYRLNGSSIKKLAQELNLPAHKLYNWRAKAEFRVPMRADMFDAVWNYYTTKDLPAFNQAKARLETLRKLADKAQEELPKMEDSQDE